MWLSKIGSYGLIWIGIAVVLALVWRRATPLLLVLPALAVADGLTRLLKLAVGFDRPRDGDPLVAIPHSHSFPSGHTASAFAGATVLSALAPSGRVGFYGLAAAIGYSRVYLGVHWPLDVLAGGALGVVTALLLLAGARRRSVRLRQ